MLSSQTYKLAKPYIKSFNALGDIFTRGFSLTRGKFDSNDPIRLDHLLNEDDKMIQQSVRDYCDSLFPNITKMFREKNMDRQIFKDFGELGVLGMGLTGYGAEISNLAKGLVNRELGRLDSGIWTSITVQGTISAIPIWMFGTQEQKDKYLPKIVSGDFISCFCLSEPNHGSDPSSMETRAIKKGDKYIVNGQKTWITNGPIGDVFVTWAKDENGDIIGLIVDRDCKGLSTTEIDGKTSVVISKTGMVFYEDCEVPVKNVLSGVKGLKGPLSVLSEARYGVGWQSLGSAEFCFQHTRDYCMDRKQFGKPLASFQLIQNHLAEMETEISLCASLCLRIAQLKDLGNEHISPELMSMMKKSVSRKALNIAREARDMLGGNGIIDEYHIARHMMNLESVNTYEGAYSIHNLSLGRGITGYNAFV